MNLPVRPIRKRCEKIIAVEINSIDTSEKITNMIGMAIRSFHLGLDRNTDIDRNMCDVFISPQNMTKYSMFDLEHIREIYEEGYLTAKRILKKIRSYRPGIRFWPDRPVSLSFQPSVNGHLSSFNFR